MTRRSTWWRRLRGLLAALALAVLTLGPSLDGVICHDEDGMSAAAATQAFIAVQNAGHAKPGHDLGLSICAHGHCHHASPYVPVETVVADGPMAPAARHELVRNAVPTSHVHFGLKRPPRA